MLIRLKIVFPSSATNTTHCTSLPALWPDDGVVVEVICGAQCLPQKCHHCIS